KADSTTDAASFSIAAALGLGLAGSGSVATAIVNPSLVGASVEGGSIFVSNAATIQATARDGAAADAIGINVSAGASVGASEATARVFSHVDAHLGASTVVNAGSLTVSAAQLVPSSIIVFNDVGTEQTTSGVSVFANSTGASGALLAGINATSST